VSCSHSKKWIESVNAIGIVSKPGRYGRTYASETDVLNMALPRMIAELGKKII